MPAQYTVRPQPPLEPCIGETVIITLSNGLSLSGELGNISMAGNTTLSLLSPNKQYRTTHYFNVCDVVSFELTEFIGEQDG